LKDVDGDGDPDIIPTTMWILNTPETGRSIGLSLIREPLSAMPLTLTAISMGAGTRGPGWRRRKDIITPVVGTVLRQIPRRVPGNGIPSTTSKA